MFKRHVWYKCFRSSMMLLKCSMFRHLCQLKYFALNRSKTICWVLLSLAFVGIALSLALYLIHITYTYDPKQLQMTFMEITFMVNSKLFESLQCTLTHTQHEFQKFQIIHIHYPYKASLRSSPLHDLPLQQYWPILCHFTAEWGHKLTL